MDPRLEAFLRLFPDYRYTAKLDELRATEYGHLGHCCYLDYTGANIPAACQIKTHAHRLTDGLFGNPHSGNFASEASTRLIEAARATVLHFFSCSGNEWEVIFTANASAACKLVGESFPFGASSRFAALQDSHNSDNGMREFARARGAAINIVRLQGDMRISEADLFAVLDQASPDQPNLLVLTGQSNFSGVQHPLTWIESAQARGWTVLLDAAAFVPSNKLDLTLHKPDFVAVSIYKICGYPTGVGCLLARKDALAKLQRPWFSGGSILAASALGDWHILASGGAAFEDGTPNFLSIPDVTNGLVWISQIGLPMIHTRVHCLTGWLLHCLPQLQHSNGQPMVRIYGPTDMVDRGGTIALNFLDPDGNIVDERIISGLANGANIVVRTGCFCNPGAGEAAFGLNQSFLHGAQGDLSLLNTVPRAVRISIGFISTFGDIERFLAFAATFKDQVFDSSVLSPRSSC